MDFQGRLVSLTLLMLVVICVPARADVMYQCVDADGHKSFSNLKSEAKGARCTVLDLGPAPSIPTPSPKAASGSAGSATPSTFPKVDENTQRARDNDRRRILENELSEEQKNLEKAKKALADQEATVLPSERMQGGAISGGKVEERVQPFKDKVALHERNIEAIQKEIGRLR